MEQYQRSHAKHTLPSRRQIFVDVIIPVHNARDTVEDAVRSAMKQVVPDHLVQPISRDDSCLNMHEVELDVAVCCYDDGSSDESWSILSTLREEFESSPRESNLFDRKLVRITTTLLIDSSKDGVARGAGYARNQAASLRSAPCCTSSNLYFLCLLDSDDTMHCSRVAEQLHAMLSLPSEERSHTILGCNFDRDPPDSTWHYAQWANSLSDERLMLERYREVTVLQPTWFLAKARFLELGGYIEAPLPDKAKSSDPVGQVLASHKHDSFQLIHPTYDTSLTLRLAEDLRLFHAHMHANGMLRLHRTPTALVTYRHRVGMSQSSQTPRKLLLHLRIWAFESTVLRSNPHWLKNGGSFVVWGAGRDGKDFVKSMSDDLRHRVACFVDVDYKKISAGFYVNKEIGVKIPIVHFSVLARNPETRKKLLASWEAEIQDDNTPQTGRIDKSKKATVVGARPEKNAETPSDQADHSKKERQETRAFKRRKVHPLGSRSMGILPQLPVVVCVALYRTNGALERNVRSIGRTEGKDLWHFS